MADNFKKCRLVRVPNGYALLVDNIMYATDNDKLPLKKCQEIDRGYDLDRLAEEKYREYPNNPSDKPEWHYNFDPNAHKKRKAFKAGFQKAIDLIGSNTLTLDKFLDLYIEETGYGMDMWGKLENEIMSTVAKIFQSMDQDEWDVEIEMEWNPKSTHCDECGNGGKYMESPCDHKDDCNHWSPKLDPDGFLIMRKIKNI